MSKNRQTNDTAKKASLPNLYRRAQVAAMCNVCAVTIKRWERAGLLKPIKVNARLTLYEEGNVMELLKNSGLEVMA